MKVTISVETGPVEIAQIIHAIRQPDNGDLSQLKELYHQHLAYLHKEVP